MLADRAEVLVLDDGFGRACGQYIPMDFRRTGDVNSQNDIREEGKLGGTAVRYPLSTTMVPRPCVCVEGLSRLLPLLSVILVRASGKLLLHSWAHQKTKRQSHLTASGTGSASSVLKRLADPPECPVAATNTLGRLLTVPVRQRVNLTCSAAKNVAESRDGSSQAAAAGTSLPYRRYGATRKFRFSRRPVMLPTAAGQFGVEFGRGLNELTPIY